MDFEPLAIEYRGDLPDLVHVGRIAVVDEHSRPLYTLGDVRLPVFYRSAAKPIQALPLFMRGLDERFGLSDAELAITGASHMGEPYHIAALESMHKKCGLNESDMIMAPDHPGTQAGFCDWLRAGLPERKLYHNCSGKHTALMMVQRDMGAPVGDYWKKDAPVQAEAIRAVSVLSQWPVDAIHIAIDGCGVPVFALPLQNIAAAFKNLACPDQIEDGALAAAAVRMTRAMNRHPEMISAHGRLCTVLNRDKNIVAKGGANAVYALALKRERIGIAFKLVGGATAPEPLIVRRLLMALGYDNAHTLDALAALNDGLIRNHNATVVGRLETVFTPAL